MIREIGHISILNVDGQFRLNFNLPNFNIFAAKNGYDEVEGVGNTLEEALQDLYEQLEEM